MRPNCSHNEQTEEEKSPFNRKIHRNLQAEPDSGLEPSVSTGCVERKGIINYNHDHPMHIKKKKIFLIIFLKEKKV